MLGEEGDELPPAEGEEEEQATGEQEKPEDPMRGYVGWVYKEMFEELYPPTGSAAPGQEPRSGQAAVEGEPVAAAEQAETEAEGAVGGSEESPPQGAKTPAAGHDVLDLSEEEHAIAAVKEQLEKSRVRMSDVKWYLQNQQATAAEEDREIAEYLLEQGLTIKEQFPVGETMLRVDEDALLQESLMVPHNVMVDLEREIAIETGQKLKHPNLLSISKPEEPNYYKATASLQIRAQTRGIQSRLNEAQRQTLRNALAERRRRRPPMPPMLNAEERNENREILRRMQTKVSFLKNPRFLASRDSAKKGVANPFRVTPSQVVFRDFEVGSVYEISVEIRNSTNVGRRLRVLPCASAQFSSSEPMYEANENSSMAHSGFPTSVVAPGMAAFLKVRFAPETLNDQDEQLTICTEFGDYTLPVLSRRVQPQLDFDDPVDLGCILAGQQMMQKIKVKNRGGEAAFRFVATEGRHRYEMDPKAQQQTFICENFRVTPATFYLESDQSVEVEVGFGADEVGEHRQPLFMECDNGDKIPITLKAITDAVRCELVRWPSRPGPCDASALGYTGGKGPTPLTFVPWMLNWLNPGVQIGKKSSQSITVANGGYLPMKVHWNMAQPPRSVLTQLAVGGMPFLTQAVLEGACHWHSFPPNNWGSEACPFAVQPRAATIAPFSTATFHFSYHAKTEAGIRATIFSYLTATEVPRGGQCVLDFAKMLELQATMRPKGFTERGIPLGCGGKGTLYEPLAKHSPEPVNTEVLADTKNLVLHAVALQGLCVMPKLRVSPPLLSFGGDTTAFLTHTRTITLTNDGLTEAYFRVRLSSDVASGQPGDHPPEEHEEGRYPQLYTAAEEELPKEDSAVLERVSEAIDPPNVQLTKRMRLLEAAWPPLPPDPPGEGFDGRRDVPGSAAWLPGSGALATVVVRPSKGVIQPGETCTLEVMFRGKREADVDSKLLIDVPSGDEDGSRFSLVPPMPVRVMAALRAARLEMKDTSLADFGVVRAHSKHSMTVFVQNPTELPTLMRLTHHMEEHAALTGKAVASASVPGDLANRRDPGSKHISDSQDLGKVGGFPFKNHADVVNEFVAQVRREGGLDELLNPKILPRGQGASSRGGVQERAAWVHARSGCLDRSGRPCRYRVAGDPNAGPGVEELEGASDEVDFQFNPDWVLVPPKRSMPIEITLRTGAVEKFRGLLRVVGFDSAAWQCLEVMAEVQLPRVRLEPQHVHYPVTYSKTASEAVRLKLWNDSDMPAPFKWRVPSNLNAGLEVALEPPSGVVDPRSALDLNVSVVPTKREAEHTAIECFCYIGDVIQPLMLKVSARIYGLQVDYAVIPFDEPNPIIDHAPRGWVDEEAHLGTVPGPTYPVLGKHPRKGCPAMDFGHTEIQKTKKMKLVIYNRSGIATPFGVKMRNYPAFDPVKKGKQVGKMLEAVTRMQSFSGTGESPSAKQTHANEPQPAGEATDAEQKKKRSKIGPKKWILDDKHERQAFRSATGAEFAKQKEMKELGAVALNYGRGYAVKLEPSNDWLQPFGSCTVICTCYSDLPGPMLDELRLTVRNLPPEFNIPVRLTSHGNPLFLPPQQVCLSQHYEPPRLKCGTIVPAEREVKRTFRVSNSSATKIRISWKVYPTMQIENATEERQFVNVSLCSMTAEDEDPEDEEGEDGARIEDEDNEDEGSDVIGPDFPCAFRMWANEPPPIRDPFQLLTGKPPMKIEPAEAILPEHGSALFTLTMSASAPAPPSSEERWRSYKLVGKGRYARSDMVVELPKEEDEEAETGEGSKPEDEDADEMEEDKIDPVVVEGTMASLQARHRSSLDVDVVRDLPELPLDVEALDDDDSDLEDDTPGWGAEEAGHAAARPGLGSSGPTLIPPGAAGLAVEGSAADAPLPEEPDRDVVSTLVLDCMGECILPHLTLDKKLDPARNVPALKFFYSSVPPPFGRGASELPSGTVTLGGGHDAPIPGIAMAVVRTISLTNDFQCNVSVRFRTEGPFKIKQIDQVGKRPVRPMLMEKKAEAESKMGITKKSKPELFVVAWRQSVALQIQFVPPALSKWEKGSESVFHGDLVLEYPRDPAGTALTVTGGDDVIKVQDEERIHLLGTARKPALDIVVVPFVAKEPPEPPMPLEMENPPWGAERPPIVDFTYTHVDMSAARRRQIFVRNDSNVVAKWRLFHVARPKTKAQEVGMTVREIEDLSALDEPSVFSFDVADGELPGPSKPVRLLPLTTTIPRALPHEDEHRYEPQMVTISFLPKKNELYKCRFRLQVENGKSVDFICRGCGSYDEEDDAMEMEEA